MWGSKTWCLQENEKEILKKTKKAMMGAMCGVELIEKRCGQELGLKKEDAMTD